MKSFWVCGDCKARICEAAPGEQWIKIILCTACGGRGVVAEKIDVPSPLERFRAWWADLARFFDI